MSYFNQYKELLNQALNNINQMEIDSFYGVISKYAEKGYPILVCGNGGSAAISEHLSCDHTKGVACDTNLKPFIISLPSNVSLTTAIANDIGYEEVFAKQVEWFTDPRAALLVISSSGNSPNIVRALQSARNKNMHTMAMVGFDGGAVVKDNLADFTIHVKSNNYGIVEDCHQILMHSMAQSLRLSHSNKPNLKL